MRMLLSSSLTVPDVQFSRFRFFMEELCSRRCSDGQSGLPAEGDAVGVQRTGSWGTDSCDTGSLPLRPARLLAPLYGSDWNVQPSGAFTSRLSTDRSPSPLLDITTTATGLLCWRDSHPLEWQLVSLHGH